MSHFEDYRYDYYDAFYGEDTASSHPDADHEIESQFDDYDDSMDGDHDSAMTSCGWGTDEDYGYYGDDREDFHSDDGCGYYDDF
jgi:hypothetical protein